MCPQNDYHQIAKWCRFCRYACQGCYTSKPKTHVFWPCSYCFPHPATCQEFPDAEIHVYERSEHVGGRARVFQHGRHSYEAQDAIGVPLNWLVATTWSKIWCLIFLFKMVMFVADSRRGKHGPVRDVPWSSFIQKTRTGGLESRDFQMWRTLLFGMLDNWTTPEFEKIIGNAWKCILWLVGIKDVQVISSTYIIYIYICFKDVQRSWGVVSMVSQTHRCPGWSYWIWWTGREKQPRSTGLRI